MSLVRRRLNAYLRWSEKRHLALAADIDTLRRSFAFRARLFFHGPFGSHYEWDDLGGIPVQWAMARGVTRGQGPVILYFHGGGYVFGSTDTHRAMAAALSKRARLPVCLVDYRLAPEHPFPAAVDDAVAAYASVMAQPVILGGDSAGGGLALALLAEILRRDMPRPFATFAFSPLTDLTFSGASIVENAEKEVMLPASRIGEISQAYLSGAAAEDPRASPLFADFTDAPPVWLTVGTTEILRDDTLRLADRMQAQSVDVTLLLEKNVPHVWPMFHSILPEARQTLTQLADWISARTGSGDS
ncbi:MAG: alpha/beta hydrolase fold domain-containing protein [Pseudomonadota bacterium]